MVAKNREEILSLVGQIDHVLQTLQHTVEETRTATRAFQGSRPGTLDLRGFGSLLHDFYTGIEDVFEIIAGDINGRFPDSPEWHKQLLVRMTVTVPGLRPAVISEELRWKLDEYLRFRHVFRNVYGYLLDWERLKPLLDRMDAVYAEFLREVGSFRAFLLRLAEQLT
jgi:uncharacterized protein YutE (UPF0331/DUF86 family)